MRFRDTEEEEEEEEEEGEDDCVGRDCCGGGGDSALARGVEGVTGVGVLRIFESNFWINGEEDDDEVVGRGEVKELLLLFVGRGDVVWGD